MTADELAAYLLASSKKIADDHQLPHAELVDAITDWLGLVRVYDDGAAVD
jgi:hypothetical protein